MHAFGACADPLSYPSVVTGKAVVSFQVARRIGSTPMNLVR